LNDEPSHCHKIEYIDNLDKVVSDNKYDEVWIIGGEKMYSRIVKENIQIKNIYVNYIDKDYNCDKFFPFEIFHKNDKMRVIGKQVVNNTNQYIMKVERNIFS
jgi:dihydrofolate reductase